MKKEKRNEKGRNKKHLLYGVLLIGWIFFVAGCGLQEEPPEKSTTPASPPKATGEAKPTESPEEVTEQEEPKLTDMPEQDDSDLDANLLKLLAGMSTEEKVGQMFLVRCPKEAETAVSEYKVGGFVLFARDFEGNLENPFELDIPYKTKVRLEGSEYNYYKEMEKFQKFMTVVGFGFMTEEINLVQVFLSTTKTF